MMTVRSLLAAVALCTLTLAARAADGMLLLASPRDVTHTTDRVVDLIAQRGLTLFARVDHAAGALQAGMNLRPTQLVIFGHAKGGTPLMQCAQTVAIDLPMKILVWEDDQGRVWLGYNDPAYLTRRHGVPQCTGVDNLSKAISTLAEAAVAE